MKKNSMVMMFKCLDLYEASSAPILKKNPPLKWVALTLVAKTDIGIPLRQRMIAQMARVVGEAFEKGAALSIEDLIILFGTNPATTGRYTNSPDLRRKMCGHWRKMTVSERQSEFQRLFPHRKHHEIKI